jgi:thiol-disulfide isomerase/thioredoxin
MKGARGSPLVSLPHVLPLLAALALVAVATGIGVAWRLLDGRARRGSGARVAPGDVGVSAAEFGDAATLLQFSSESCARCPAARRLLAGLADARPGVRHVEVDLTHRIDLATRFGVLATPTTFVLDRQGRVRTRIVGAPRPQVVAAALAPLHR